MLFRFINRVLNEKRPAHLAAFSEDRYLYAKLSEHFNQGRFFSTTDLHEKNINGQTALQWLVKRSFNQSLTLLIENNSLLVHQKDSNGRNLFQYALELGKYKFCNEHYQMFSNQVSTDHQKKREIKIILGKLSHKISIIRNTDFIGLLAKVVSYKPRKREVCVDAELFPVHDKLKKLMAISPSSSTGRRAEMQDILAKNASICHALLVNVYAFRGKQNCCTLSDKFKAAAKKVSVMR